MGDSDVILSTFATVAMLEV